MALDYKLEKETESQLVFKQSGGLWWLIAIFCLIGGVMLFFGAIGFAVDISNGDMPDKIGFILTGAGLIFSSGGLIIWTTRFDNPKYFIFDNERGVLHVHQKRKEDDSTADIPYSDIEGFTMRTRVSTSNNSSGSSSSTTHYVVCWFKKDGSIWDLSQSTNREKSEQLKMKLESWVQLEKPSVNIVPPRVPESVQLVQSGARVGFQWKNKIGAKVLLFLAVLSGFGCITAGIYISEGAITPVWVLGGFVSLITSLLMYYIVKSLTTTYMVAVTSSALQLLHNDQVKKSMALQDIAAISFDFKDEQGGSGIRVLNHEQYNYVRKKMITKQFEFSDIAALFKFAKDTFRLDMEGLDVVDKLHVEQMLQKIIFEKGGISVL